MITSITNHKKFSCTNNPTRIGLVDYFNFFQQFDGSNPKLYEENLDTLKGFCERNDIIIMFSQEFFDIKAFGLADFDKHEVISLLLRYNTLFIFYDLDQFYDYKVIPEERLILLPWFIKTNLYISSSIRTIYEKKPYVFSCLLGGARPERQLMFDELKNLKECYLTYFGNNDSIQSSNFSLEDDRIKDFLFRQKIGNGNRLITFKPVQINGKDYYMSQIVPTNIYNNCHFDIICETRTSHGEPFLASEKTAKSLATARYFCHYAPPKYLEYLSNYGFDFTGYENDYDLVNDDSQRLQGLFDKVKYIAKHENKIKYTYKQSYNSRLYNQKHFFHLKDISIKKLQNFLFEACKDPKCVNEIVPNLL